MIDLLSIATARRRVGHPTRRLNSALLLILLFIAAPAIAEVDRAQVAAFIDDLVARHDFDREQLSELLDGAESQTEIIERISRPVERTLTWAGYRRIFLDRARIDAGVAFIEAHGDTLDRAERVYGVPPHYVTAVLGVETRYGERRGDWRVLDALYTLGFDYPPRMSFFRKELEEFLLLAREEGRAPGTLVGSYAGAMGWGQFIPSSYRHYAVDFDGDDVRDIWDNPVDAIGSVANYFAEHHWRAGAPVLRRVGAIDGADLAGVANRGLRLRTTVAELRALGVTGLDGLEDEVAAGLWRVQGPDGEELIASFGNFRTITRYNHSHLYALAVHDLATSIASARARAEQAEAASR